jgi:class 3 adenylate cyclase/tetratricopeptide (TPR) repeat protein
MGADMIELPEGPVTIMFTDIEGSTALRTSLGDTETDALFREHDEIVRAQIEENRGNDQKAALGDGFLAVFVSTRRALACAIGIQRALDSFNINRAGPPLRVRIGLNTGEVAWQDGQLSGEAVHAAARVCAEATGGQIFISDVTRQLAGTVADVTFHDSGEHALKGFPQPWRLWDVIWVRETTGAPQQVFVGREPEMAALRAKLNSALDGRGGCVLIGGEPGVGKTTLVRQLIREAEQRGALAVFGRCYESEGTVPYSPFVEMLEQALSIIPGDIVREDMGADAPEVARMVPELRRRFPDIGESLDLPPEQQRRYFFNAVGSFISRGAARFPLMLVLDDVHWADEPTLLLIEHMAALVPEIRVLAVATYRDVELEVSRPLAAAIERLVRGRLIERISVKRFDRDGVAKMVEALASKPPPDAVVDAIFEETEGNPFFVEEVFWHLVEEGKVFDETGAFRANLTVNELDVPESVRLVVGRRLERLGETAQKTLAAGAVVGRAFPFSLLEDLSDIDPGSLLDIVEQAEAARVIVPEERDGEIHYSFAHELIRQTLLSGLSLLRRQRLHLAVANAIERTDKRAREERPSEIAHHLVQAGAAAESDRTLEYLDLAAARAMDAAAFEEALRLLDDALSVIDADDELARTKLLERKGYALRAVGRFDQCLEILGGVVDTYVRLGEAERAAEVLREMAYQYLWLGRFGDVMAANQRGIDVLDGREVQGLAFHIGGLGALLGVGGFLDAALERIDEAEAVARKLNDDRALGWVLWTRCLAYYSATRAEEAIEPGLAAIDLLRRSGDLWSLCDALSWTALSYTMHGQLAKAAAMGAEGVELSQRLGHVGGEILAHRAVIGTEAGRNPDLERWERDIRRDIELCESIDSPWASQGYVWLGTVTQLRGSVDEAQQHFDRAAEIEPVSAYSGLPESYRLVGLALARDREGFLEGFERARPRFSGGAAYTPWGNINVAWCAAQGAAMLGLAEIADEAGQHLASPQALPFGFFDGALTARVHGMIASVNERWDEAERYFETALQQVTEIGNKLDEPQVHHWYAKMLLDRGRPEDRERANRMIDSALEGYRRIGLPLHAAMAEELLASI